MKLFPSKSMLTARFSLLNSSPRCDGNTCLGQDLFPCKWVLGVIWETSRYLMLAGTYQVGRYGTWVTWDPSGAMAERAEGWLTGVPKVALSSSAVAGESHPEQLALLEKCWVPLTWTPATLSCTSQFCMDVLKMLRQLKQCWALMGAQLHLVTSASQCYQNVSSCQKWGCCFLLHPSTHSTQNQVQVKPIKCQCAR